MEVSLAIDDNDERRIKRLIYYAFSFDGLGSAPLQKRWINLLLTVGQSMHTETGKLLRIVRKKRNRSNASAILQCEISFF